MTEEKPKENLKESPKVEETLRKGEEELRRVIREELSKALPQNTVQTSKNISDTSESQPSPKHEHWKAEEITKISGDCPECKAEKEKLKDAFGKPYLEEHWREKLPNVCANEKCGEGVLVEEDKECPRCHERNYKKRA
jgi:hypothetical protein